VPRPAWLKSSGSLRKSSRGFNRQSVQEAIRSLQARLSQYKTLPPLGLACFAGSFNDEKGRPQRLCVAVEPLEPIQQNSYRCDSEFHLDLLRSQLEDHAAVGVILIDGQSVTLFAVAGSNHHVLFDWQNVALPKKHGRGGQSQNRFARLRTEKRDWYLTRVEELAVQHFIDKNTNGPTVLGLILAGNADFKSELAKRLDPRLTAIVLAVVDVQYNGTVGLHEALDKAEPHLRGLGYFEEKRDLAQFFEGLRTSGPVTFGPRETIRLLTETGGAVQRLLVWTDLILERQLWARGSERRLEFVVPQEATEVELEAGWEMIERGPLLGWLLEHASEFGAEISLISGQTPTGQQFVVGFGGIGGLLRYSVELAEEESLMGGKDEKEEEEFEW